MLDDKTKILKDNVFLKNRKNAKILSSYKKAKAGYLLLSVFLSLVVIVAIYFVSNKSNVYHIAVQGNVYLSDEDIIDISGLNSDSKYVLTLLSNQTTKRILDNPLINSCRISSPQMRLITIQVEEKKLIGYAYENSLNVLVTANDERIELTKENLYLISSVPLLEGFNGEQLRLIGKNLNDIDYKIINEISEMHYYPSLKYQDHEIIMRDGNYIFTSVYGLNVLNHYYDIVSSDNGDKNKCYYVEDISGNVYTSACPWENQPEQVNEQ